jgi:hypothetical protein
MSRLNLQYLLLCLVTCLLANAAVALFFITLVPAATGLAYVAACLTNIFVAGVIALMAGRKSATAYKLEDPRLGAVSGTVMGFWVAAGAALGLLATASVLDALFRLSNRASNLNYGLVVAFSVLGAFVCIIASRIAGREAAHPPEEEDEV